MEKHNISAAVLFSFSCTAVDQYAAVTNTPCLHTEPCCEVCVYMSLCVETALIKARLHSDVLWPAVRIKTKRKGDGPERQITQRKSI